MSDLTDKTKTILCYGDSNTWGAIPGNRWQRLAHDKRWCTCLQRLLGKEYLVIEEGCCGRTIALDDPIAEGRNGIESVVAVFESHRPISLVVLFLGTNDLKLRYQMSLMEISRNMARLIRKIRSYPCGKDEMNVPHILIVSPTVIREGVERVWEHMYDAKSVQLSKQLGQIFKEVAEIYGCAFIDAAAVTTASNRDMLHLEESGHQAVANAVYCAIMDLNL